MSGLDVVRCPECETRDRSEIVSVRSGTVADIPDTELLRRVVETARLPSRHPHTRATAVKYVFLLGSTFAAQLCRRFGLDPEERVR